MLAKESRSRVARGGASRLGLKRTACTCRDEQRHCVARGGASRLGLKPLDSQWREQGCYVARGGASRLGLKRK